MKCPYCADITGHGNKTKVLDTREFWEPTSKYFYIERRRECTSCGERFTTKERSPVVKDKR